MIIRWFLYTHSLTSWVPPRKKKISSLFQVFWIFFCITLFYPERTKNICRLFSHSWKVKNYYWHVRELQSTSRAGHSFNLHQSSQERAGKRFNKFAKLTHLWPSTIHVLHQEEIYTKLQSVSPGCHPWRSTTAAKSIQVRPRRNFLDSFPTESTFETSDRHFHRHFFVACAGGPQYTHCGSRKTCVMLHKSKGHAGLIPKWTNNHHKSNIASRVWSRDDRTWNLFRICAAEAGRK